MQEDGGDVAAKRMNKTQIVQEYILLRMASDEAVAKALSENELAQV